MKKHIWIIVLLLLVKSGLTQNTNLDYKYAIKVYNLSSYEENSRTRMISDSLSYFNNISDAQLQIFHPTVAFQWKTKRNNFHEIELTGFKLNKQWVKTEIINDTGHDNHFFTRSYLTTALASVRYEFTLNFNKSKDKKFVPSVGFGANPYYRQEDETPGDTLLFHASQKYIGLRAFVIPRLTYYVSSKFFIDLNIPLCLFEMYYLIDKEDNPAIAAHSRINGTFNFGEFPKMLSLRIGAGLKL